MRKLSQGEWIAVISAIVVVAFFFVLGNWSGLFTQSETGVPPTALEIENIDMVTPTTIQDGVGIANEVSGEGREAQKGDTVVVHYTGKFQNGQVFDSSIPRGEAFEFTLGAGGVIEGWDKGIVGMKVGGKRTLVIPAELGYGPDNYGPIPGGSTLIFDVELVGIK